MRGVAGIYERKGRLFIVPYDKTKAGFWISNSVTATVERDNLEGMLEAVAAALMVSREGVPTPPPDFDPTAPLLLAAGVASWSTFARSAKSVDVELVNGVVEITPYQNRGARQGFVPIREKAVRLPEGDPSIGPAILVALQAAE